MVIKKVEFKAKITKNFNQKWPKFTQFFEVKL